MSRGEVLVGIVNSAADFSIVRDEGWYRVPVESQRKWLAKRWPPKWVAFYLTKAFGDEAHSVRYYAEVRDIRQVARRELFPEEMDGASGRKAGRLYHQVMLGPLQELPRPIFSRRYRRIVFIPTTWEKLVGAAEINDLFDESPLEDRLWAELKRLEIQAECQEYVEVNGRSYFLDFAIYCSSGKLDVETDGDRWHADPKRIPKDNERDNDLATDGWARLRFNGMQVREKLTEYCVPTITDNIKRLGGVEEGRIVPRDIGPGGPEGSQLGLFDD